MKSSHSQELLTKIAEYRAETVVVGLGYVGLALAVAAAQGGLPVTGIDTDPEKVQKARSGNSYTDLSCERLRAALDTGRLRIERRRTALESCDIAVICVPTPLRKSGEPDISYVTRAVSEVADRLRPGSLVILESTTWPGTTEEYVRPCLEMRNLRVGRDVFVAFSPERIDPGNLEFGLENTPKVVGGCTSACTRVAAAFYGKIARQVVPVSSPAAAEMCKLLENTSRAVNIALANEIALICEQIGLDAHEVIRAAATKPFGFQPYWPGPGLGGHCIPVDPGFLVWKIRQHDMVPRLIETADEVNRCMPKHIAMLLAEAMGEAGETVHSSKIGLVGVAYKRDVGDCRESPALRVEGLLRRMGAETAYHDPHVPELSTEDGRVLTSSPLGDLLDWADGVLLMTDHSSFDMESIVEGSRVLIDTRNATIAYDAPHIRRLGHGRRPKERRNQAREPGLVLGSPAGAEIA